MSDFWGGFLCGWMACNFLMLICLAYGYFSIVPRLEKLEREHG